jgi:F0F1-type ATP synthase epsilon subunit
MDIETIEVKIVTPQETLYDGKAIAISSRNSQGSFDLLAEHANFITIIDKQPITVYKPDHTTVVFSFLQAVVYLENNKVTVFGNPLPGQSTK